MKLQAPHVLAADTNIGMDLAGGNDWAIDALSTIRRRLPESSLLVPPTVSEELAWLADHAQETLVSEAALEFLHRHRTWGFQLLHTVPLGDSYVGRIAERLLRTNLLPSSEVNNAHILAESAALGCSILLTSDRHLRAIDFQRLSLVLASFDLVAPVIATPREIILKFFRS